MKNLQLSLCMRAALWLALAVVGCNGESEGQKQNGTPRSQPDADRTARQAPAPWDKDEEAAPEPQDAVPAEPDADGAETPAPTPDESEAQGVERETPTPGAPKGPQPRPPLAPVAEDSAAGPPAAPEVQDDETDTVAPEPPEANDAPAPAPPEPDEPPATNDEDVVGAEPADDEE